MRTPKEILYEHRVSGMSAILSKMILEVQTEAYNQALEDASKIVDERLKDESQIRAFLIDGSSILKLKKSVSKSG